MRIVVRMADGHQPGRRPTNLSLPKPLVEEARALGVNLSAAAERGVAQAVRAAKRAKWLEENREAIEAWNEWVEKNGIPLLEYRQF